MTRSRGEGERDIDLVKQTSDATGVAKFLTEKDGGRHHQSFEIDEINGVLIGVHLINEIALELPQHKMVFVHPMSTSGE